MAEYFTQFGEQFPQALRDEHAALLERLQQG